MSQPRVAGSRSLHPQEIDARSRKTSATAVRAQRISPSAARRGRAAGDGAGWLMRSLSWLSASSVDFTPAARRSRIFGAIASMVGLQIFPEAAAPRGTYAGRLLLRGFALPRIVMCRCCGAGVGVCVRRLGSGLDSKCRHGHLLEDWSLGAGATGHSMSKLWRPQHRRCAACALCASADSRRHTQ
jgi:hypothetical protein